MIYLRQSTASQEVPLGPFIDSTDGDTEKTALTIATTDIKVWKNGATTLANKNSGGATHISNGIYYAVLDATDTDTIGSLVLFVHVATALAVRVPCVVLDEAVYDVRFGTVAPATATNITGGTITTVTNLTNDPTGVGTLLTRMGTPSDLGSGATVANNLSDIEGFADDIPAIKIKTDSLTFTTANRVDSQVFGMQADTVTAAAIATDAIGSAELAASAVTKIAAGITVPSAATIADAVWDEDTTGHTTSGTFGEQLKTDVDAILVDTGTTLQGELDGIQADTEDIQTKIGTPSDLGGGATVAANLAAIEAQTDDIGAAGAGLTALPWNPAWDAEVESEANDALVAQNLDHLMKIAVDTDFPTTVHLNSVVGYLADNGTAASFDRTADSLEAIAGAGGGGGLDAQGVRDAIGLASANLDTQLDALPTNAELTAALAAADDAVLAAIAALNNLSQANIRTAIGLASANLDTQLADLPTNSELATALAAADDPVLAAIAALNNLSQANVRSALGLAAANLDTQLGDLPTNGELATALASADDAVLAAIAALNNLSMANVRTALGMASANLDTQLGDLPTNAELATALAAADDATLAAIAGLNNLSAAQVNAEVVDALTVDVIADSTPALGSRPTIAAGVLLTTRLLAEKEVAGTTVTVNKEDGVTPALTLTLDDAANPTSISRAT